MIVKFTQSDESDRNFPFGERYIDASPWIKQGYTKINDYRISNPNPVPLEKNFKLVVAINNHVERFKKNNSELYTFFEKKNSYDEFLKKDIKIEYVYSTFNQYSNLPTNDNFVVTFDDYKIKIKREFENDSIYLFAFDLERIDQPKTE